MTRRAGPNSSLVIRSTAKNLSSLFVSLLLIAALAVITISCGGGGGASVVTPPPPPPPSGPPPVITAMSLPQVLTGSPYSTTLQVTGGTTPYTWSLVANGGNLFQGLTLSSSGVINGTMPSTGSCAHVGCFTSFMVQVRDSAGRTDFEQFNLLSADPLVISTPGSLGMTNVGTLVNFFLNRQGGIAPFMWSVAPGSSLPSGLSFQNPSLITGYPLVSGNYSFDIRISDSSSPQQTATQTFTLGISNNLNLIFETMSLAVVQYPYTFFLRAVGGTPPYTFSLQPGVSLPAGMALDPATGEVSGTPTQAHSNYGFNVTVVDSANPPASTGGGFNLTIRPPLSFLTSSLPDGVDGLFYSGRIFGDGGRPPLNLNIISGSLPAGMTVQPLNTWFEVGGTPTQTGVSTFTAELVDSNVPPARVTQSFSLAVNPRLMLNPTNPPSSIEGIPYSFTFTATGGTPPLTWSGQSVPAGLTLDAATGVLSGTPIGPHSNMFVTVRDSSNPPQQASSPYSFTIAEILRIVTDRLPPITVGAPVRLFAASTGGICCGPSWQVSAGALPPGLVLSAPAGPIEGTPTATGTFGFTLRVDDNNVGSLNQFAEQSYQWIVHPIGQLGRNDSIATATPITNGYYRASFSPLSGPTGGPALGDSDYYQVVSKAGSTVRINAYQASFDVDTVLEIVDASGVPFTACSLFANPNGPFNSACLNDDISSSSVESELLFRVPGMAGTHTTFFVRVLDWSGNARPDFHYDIQFRGIE